MGDIMSTVGDAQYRGGYHDKCGDSLGTVGDIMSTMGVILSTVGDTQYCGGHHDACGGYQEYCGGVQYCGGNLLLFEYPHSTHDIPYMYHDIPTVLKLQRMVSPHGTEHPPVLMISPCSS